MPVTESITSRGQDRLPIKLIMPRQGTERRVSGGGGPAQPFRAVDAAYRQSLRTQVVAIRTAISQRVERVPAVPVRVKLLPNAIAKSHRPERLFSKETCPIIGAGRLGE